jgi:hypothetical protein
MKTLALILFVIMGLTTSIHAQESNKTLVLTLAHDCAPANQVLPYLEEKFGEIAFAMGRAGVILANNGKEAEGILLMNVNPNTLTYTVNILFEEDQIVCMLTAGDKFQPAFDQKGRI